jgi:SAM-dependent methyltransferase
MDIYDYNRNAWTVQVENRNQWTLPVGQKEIDAALSGSVAVVLTPVKIVPQDWFPDLKGCDVLGLASAGGQQGPLLAAAGAHVTILDLTPAQLEQDRKVADQFGLSLRLVEGKMEDLSAFADKSFDLIFHPCSNMFTPHLDPVWSECFRVLRPGGIIMWGFTKPESLLIMPQKDDPNDFRLRYKMPYNDFDSLTPEEQTVYTRVNEPMLFAHSWEDQIGKLLASGFQLTHFFEDDWAGREPIDAYFKSFVAARAVKI